MSDAARLARQSFLCKPPGIAYAHFVPPSTHLAPIIASIPEAVSDSAYAAIISYAEALKGINHGSISWSIVRLYYSCFYSIRALLLLNKIIPFNGGDEMLLDVLGTALLKGGRSSHHWNWASLKKVSRLSSTWFISADSQDAYGKLREHRENVNYTHSFTDPNLHQCLPIGLTDFAKRFRAYRDDSAFLYTYLSDHLALAYPTKLIFSLDADMRAASICLPAEQIDYIATIWSIKDRCPIT